MYWSMTMGSVIVGNFISAIFMDMANQSTLIISMAIICLISTMGLSTLSLYEPKKHEVNIIETENLIQEENMQNI